MEESSFILRLFFLFSLGAERTVMICNQSSHLEPESRSATLIRFRCPILDAYTTARFVKVLLSTQKALLHLPLPPPPPTLPQP